MLDRPIPRTASARNPYADIMPRVDIEPVEAHGLEGMRADHGLCLQGGLVVRAPAFGAEPAP